MNDVLNTDSNEPTELLEPTNTEGLNFINPDEMPDLDTAEAGVSLEMKYYEFSKEGTVVRAIYNGITQINKRNAEGGLEQMDAVVFQTKEGVFINSGDNLMGQLRNLSRGTPIEITYEGKVKTSGGFNVNKFSVRLLTVKGFSANITSPTPARVAHPQAIKTDPTHQQIVERYSKLYARAKAANVDDLETWTINPKMTTEEILETGKALREIVEAAEAFE